LHRTNTKLSSRAIILSLTLWIINSSLYKTILLKNYPARTITNKSLSKFWNVLGVIRSFHFRRRGLWIRAIFILGAEKRVWNEARCARVLRESWLNGMFRKYFVFTESFEGFKILLSLKWFTMLITPCSHSYQCLYILAGNHLFWTTYSCKSNTR